MVDFGRIERKWQERWEKGKIFKVTEGTKKKKFYVLEMYPYPSAAGLHMGHIRNYAMGDAYARFRRMQGFNVLYPMGYDAFGLPAENAAIESKTHPKKYTESAIAGIKKNQQALGLSYDWSREIATCYPEYYKWNQWFFLQMLKKGLAYKREAPVNWCPKCETVLANEQVRDGKCWRCENEVEEKLIEQWFLKTTEYADELLEDLDKLKGWPEKIKTMQRNWIGKSHGLIEQWQVEGMDMKLSTFTTEPHTTYGASFMVIAPEHPIVLKLVKGTKYEKEAKEFIKKCKRMRIEDPANAEKQKEGFFIGRYVLNHLNGRKMPLFIANFAIMEYGTGIVKCTPTHDQRDYEFARKYDLGFYPVIDPPGTKLDPEKMTEAYTDLEVGTMTDAGKFTGMDAVKAKKAVADYSVKIGHGKKTVNYKLRDWGISRQRYWGTPIPIVYCNRCGMVPVPEKDLPVVLPTNVKFTGHGNPLLSHKKFVETKCPKCKGSARRETDTMDTFVDSSWYFLRYCEPKAKGMFDRKSVKYWMPVDQYIGGAEHAVMHLLYARFFIKALRDLKLLNFDEPFTRLFNQGIVYKDGHKMSKSFGNIVTQEEIAKKYGIDTARLFLLFVAAPDSQLEWSDEGIMGTYRLIMRFWKMVNESRKRELRSGKLETTDLRMQSRLHSTIKKITESMEGFKFNITIGTLMDFLNAIHRYSNDPKRPHKEVFTECLENLVVMSSPFAPHVCEEAWEILGKKPFVSVHPWPKSDKRKIRKDMELGEEMIEQTMGDIQVVLKLAKIEKPSKISIYVSEGWKYTLFKELGRILEKTKDFGEIMSKVTKGSLKKHGKEIAKMLPKFIKLGQVPEATDQKTELKILKDSKELFGKEFGCEIEILKAEDSKSDKARKASPGKPGIEVE